MSDILRRVPDTADELLDAIAAQLVADPRVASPETERRDGHGFGAAGLKVDGKIFAMVAKGRIVFKLPRTRVDELVGTGTGERFDPGHGRLMKEWLALDPQAEVDWSALAAEALAFVGKTRTG